MDYSADVLASHPYHRDARGDLLASEANRRQVCQWLGSRHPGSTHMGFPVLNREQRIVGVVTRKDLTNDDVEPSTRLADLLKRLPVVILETATVREAIDLMVTAGIGRLPLVTLEQPDRVTGIVTRSDLLEIHGERLHASRRLKRTINFLSLLPGQDAEPRHD